MARFSSRFTDDIPFKPPAGRVGRNRTFGALQTVKGRFEEGSSFDTGTDRNEREGTAVTSTDIEIPLDSRVWKPGTDTTKDSLSRRASRKRSAAIPGTTEELFETELVST